MDAIFPSHRALISFSLAFSCASLIIFGSASAITSFTYGLPIIHLITALVYTGFGLGIGALIAIFFEPMLDMEDDVLAEIRCENCQNNYDQRINNNST